MGKNKTGGLQQKVKNCLWGMCGHLFSHIRWGVGAEDRSLVDLTPDEVAVFESCLYHALAFMVATSKFCVKEWYAKFFIEADDNLCKLGGRGGREQRVICKKIAQARIAAQEAAREKMGNRECYRSWGPGGPTPIFPNDEDSPCLNMSTVRENVGEDGTATVFLIWNDPLTPAQVDRVGVSGEKFLVRAERNTYWMCNRAVFDAGCPDMNARHEFHYLCMVLNELAGDALRAHRKGGWSVRQ